VLFFKYDRGVHRELSKGYLGFEGGVAEREMQGEGQGLVLERGKVELVDSEV
jgi:hypothetical protein